MIFGIEFNWVSILAVIGGIAGVFYFVRLAVVLTKILEGMNTLMPVVPVIYSIAQQFRTDSGSSLLDQINRLNKASQTAEFAATLMQAAIDNLRAEQYRQAAPDMPASTQTVSIGGDAVGRNKQEEK